MMGNPVIVVTLFAESRWLVQIDTEITMNYIP
jgi:hypothetical protein